MKKCTKCGVEQGLEEFYKHKDKKDGLRSNCKNCLMKQNKTHYQKNKQHIKEYIKKYRKENKSKRNKYEKERRKNDPQFRITNNLRKRTYMGIISQGGTKSASTQELLGCSFDYIRIYIESQFIEGMSWENYPDWEIDHIRPMASFDLTDPEQQRQCCHYSNLRPLWAEENSSKGSLFNGMRS